MSFKEEYLFAKYKDRGFNNVNDFRSMVLSNHTISESDANKLYTRIVKYQVNKYGTTLSSSRNLYIDESKTFVVINESKLIRRNLL